MELVAIVMSLALLEYIVISVLVGRARVRYDVKAPATTGHAVFERYYRVQSNTLEQLVVFVPAIWLFGYYVSEPWAAALGGLFIVGRIVYMRGYVADPEKRGPGFAMTAVANLVLVAGSLVGAVRSLL